MRVIAYGGGVQSTAMIVLAVEGRIPGVDAALFANVGDRAENPDTLQFVREVMTPWAAERGVPIHELRRVMQRGDRKGQTEDLYDRLMREGSRSINIPVRMPDTGAPGTRSCTADFKIKVMGRWIKQHPGIAVGRPPAEVCIGISTDEIERAGRGRDEWYERRRYPLLELGLSRDDCKQVITEAGLPVPPKSSCYFCPFHRMDEWVRLSVKQPELLEKAQHLEDTLNERRDTLNRDRVYLTRYGRRVTEVVEEFIATGQVRSKKKMLAEETIGEAGCDEGVCFV